MSRWRDLSDAHLDDQLAAELKAVASAGDAEPWMRSQLLPAIRERVAERAAPTGGRLSLAWLAGLGAALGLAVVGVVAVLTLFPQSRPGGPYGEARSGDFVLSILAHQPTYSSGEPIDIEASVAYDAQDGPVEVSGSHPVTRFDVRQLDGSLRMDGDAPAACLRYELDLGRSASRKFTKVGGWDGADPDADFYAEWWRDPQLRLPAGRWEITAHSDFHRGPDCSGEQVTMAASITLTVGAQASPPPSSSPAAFIEVGLDGLRTFAVVHEIDGIPVACPDYGAEDPVVGALDGSPDDPLEPVWLVDADGRRLSVVWPRGFSVTFDPNAVLRDVDGTVMARAGETVELTQVNVDEFRGTDEDPYIARGLVFDRCYPPDARLLRSPGGRGHALRDRRRARR